MRTPDLLTMSASELDRLTVLECVSERRLSQVDADKQLGITSRHVSRLLKAFEHDGPAALVSKHRGRKSNHAYSDAVKTWVIRLIREHFHRPRYRRGCLGELVQIDGSEHHWFEDRGPKCTLLVYVDDATGRLMELRFVESESTFDHATRQYLERHGKPVAFHSDKHSVFRVNQTGATGDDGLTQFGRALHALNIGILYANSSQSKSRVERMNKTIQERLVKELRLKSIYSLDAANAFLPGFMERFNAKFAKTPASNKDLHRPLTELDDLEEILSWQENRTVSGSLTVPYDRVVYLLEPNDVTKGLQRKKVRVHDYPDGTIAIKYEGLDLPYSVFDKVRQVKQADVVSNKRLGTVLKHVQEQQQKQAAERSQKAPKRRGQRRITAERFREIHPAAL